MKFDTQFLGEYVVTGAFFWLCQLILFLGLFGAGVQATVWAKVPGETLQTLGDYQISLAAGGLVLLFFTGLMLDLLASYVPLRRESVISDLLKENNYWIKTMIGEERYFTDEDFAPIKYLGRLTSFSRLESRLLSYVMVFSEGLSLDPLHEEIRLSRTSRAIAAASVVLYFEVLVALGFRWIPLHKFTGPAAVIFYVLLFACILMARHRYRSMGSTLFSLVYATAVKRREDSEIGGREFLPPAVSEPLNRVAEDDKPSTPTR